jgi:hypothetical protein
MSKANVNFKKVERAFYKSAEFQEAVRAGAAAFSVGTKGGFGGLISRQQSTWADLHPAYADQKRREGKDPRKWVRTGRTLQVLSQGALPRKEGSRKGLRYKITPGRLWATLRPEVFKGGKTKPGKDVQKKIWKNLNYGIDVAGVAEGKGKTVRDKKGRRLSRRPGRNLTRWAKGLEPEIAQEILKELLLVLEDNGLEVKR